MPTKMRSLRIDDQRWDRLKDIATKRDTPIIAVILEAIDGIEDTSHTDRFEALAARFSELDPASGEFGSLRQVTQQARQRADNYNGPLHALLFTATELDLIEQILEAAK